MWTTKQNTGHRRSRSRRSGFTLMEVLLVMAILVIMGTLVVANFSGILFSSKKKSTKIQLQAIGKALDLYQIDMNGYPVGQDGLYMLNERPEESLGSLSKWGGPYLKKSLPLDPWGQPYMYDTGIDLNEQQYYMIWSAGPDMVNDSGAELSDDIVEYSNQ